MTRKVSSVFGSVVPDSSLMSDNSSGISRPSMMGTRRVLEIPAHTRNVFEPMDTLISARG